MRRFLAWLREIACDRLRHFLRQYGLIRRSLCPAVKSRFSPVKMQVDATFKCYPEKPLENAKSRILSLARLPIPPHRLPDGRESGLGDGYRYTKLPDNRKHPIRIQFVGVGNAMIRSRGCAHQRLEEERLLTCAKWCCYWGGHLLGFLDTPIGESRSCVVEMPKERSQGPL